MNQDTTTTQGPEEGAEKVIALDGVSATSLATQAAADERYSPQWTPEQLAEIEKRSEPPLVFKPISGVTAATADQAASEGVLEAIVRVDGLSFTEAREHAIANAMTTGEGAFLVDPATGRAEVVNLRLPTDVADRVGELTEEQIQSVLEEGATVLGLDMAAGPEQTETLFNVQRLEHARRLPVVDGDVHTSVPHTTEGSITVFKGANGQNMELVLVDAEVAFAGDLAEDVIVLTNHVGLVLAAQPFKQQEHA